jgi:hypothetical protein
VIADLLHGFEATAAPEGPCDDCKAPSRRVWFGDLQLCRPCARWRDGAARKAA